MTMIFHTDTDGASNDAAHRMSAPTHATRQTNVIGSSSKSSNAAASFGGALNVENAGHNARVNAHV